MFTWIYNWLYGYKTIPTTEPAKAVITPEEIRSSGGIPVYIITTHPEVEIKAYSMPQHARIGYLLQQIKRQNKIKALNQRQWALYKGKKYLMPAVAVGDLDESKTGFIFLSLETI